MQFSVAAAVLALAATAQAVSNSSVLYTTEIVTAYTTYCPAATTVAVNGVTYTVTEATTLTITNCPCTVVKPVYTSSSVYCNTCAAPTPAAPAPKTNGTAPKPSSPAPITASSGNKAFAISGVSLAGLLGLAAYIL